MANTLKIDINPNPGGNPRVKFDPDPLQANTLDQIFWTNNDSQPHWPGLLKADHTIDKTFFMPNQIAQDGNTSTVFSPSQAGTLNYQCSLEGHQNETGSIVVVAA